MDQRHVYYHGKHQHSRCKLLVIAIHVEMITAAEGRIALEITKALKVEQLEANIKQKKL